MRIAFYDTGSHSKWPRKDHMTVLLILALNFAGKVVLVAKPDLSLKRTLKSMKSDGLHKTDFSGSPLFRLPALVTQHFHMARYGISFPWHQGLCQNEHAIAFGKERLPV